MNQHCLTANERLHCLISEYPGIDHILVSITNLEREGRLSALSSHYLEAISGWSYSKVREVLVILESFGVLDIEHGKYMRVTQSLDALTGDEDEVFRIVKSHIERDEKTKVFISYLESEYAVGDKIAGERPLEEVTPIGREKIREIFLRLECAGFVLREGQKKRIKLCSLQPLLD